MILDIGDVSKQARPKKDQQNNLDQTIFGAVYLNDIARTTLTQSKPLIYREGAVIVREKLETEAGSPELLTAMIKRKKGFNPAASDWEFLVISGDATKITKPRWASTVSWPMRSRNKPTRSASVRLWAQLNEMCSDWW